MPGPHPLLGPREEQSQGRRDDQSSREALKHPRVHILSWDPGRGSLRAEGVIPCRIWSLALVLKQREIRVSLRGWRLWFHLGRRETQSER